jgi:hypothetical protein
MRKLVIFLLLAFTSIAGAIEKSAPDPKGQKLVADLLAALANPDDGARLAAVVPLLHKSLLTDDGKDLRSTVKDFSYKKASQNVGLYSADIDYVVKGNTMTVGFKASAEKGRDDKYFVKKKPGVAGMPAPIHVFWPDGGGEPKILDLGSL